MVLWCWIIILPFWRFMISGMNRRKICSCNLGLSLTPILSARSCLLYFSQMRTVHVYIQYLKMRIKLHIPSVGNLYSIFMHVSWNDQSVESYLFPFPWPYISAPLEIYLHVACTLLQTLQSLISRKQAGKHHIQVSVYARCFLIQVLPITCRCRHRAWHYRLWRWYWLLWEPNDWSGMWDCVIIW